jgi:hypothetical protein
MSNILAERLVWVATMSILKPIDLRDRPELRQIAKTLIEGALTGLAWSDVVNLDISRTGDSATVVVKNGTVEAVIKGSPDPDVIKVVLHEDYAMVSIWITDVRVDY